MENEKKFYIFVLKTNIRHCHIYSVLFESKDLKTKTRHRHIYSVLFESSIKNYVAIKRSLNAWFRRSLKPYRRYYKIRILLHINSINMVQYGCLPCFWESKRMKLKVSCQGALVTFNPASSIEVNVPMELDIRIRVKLPIVAIDILWALMNLYLWVK